MKNHFSRDGVKSPEIVWHATPSVAPMGKTQQFIINTAIHWRRRIFSHNLIEMGVGALMRP
jgi:hypothetical protein